MTRERFEMIQREFKLALAGGPSFFSDTPNGVNATVLLWGETIQALEEAWAERDAAIGQRDERAKRVQELKEEVETLKLGYRGFP